MNREVKPELLDQLPPDNPRAIRSRRDLQRVNACMGQARIMARFLSDAFASGGPRSIVDLGGGDGTLLLHLAKRLAPKWRSVRAVVVDRQSIVSPQTQSQFEALSWSVESCQSDIFDWLQNSRPRTADATVASLFLHHFRRDHLRTLLGYAAEQTNVFVACEPRRAGFPLLAASLLGFIGCNDVTRHDAKASVCAGFTEKELSELWPSGGGVWRLREIPAGLFSHCFIAQRTNGHAS